MRKNQGNKVKIRQLGNRPSAEAMQRHIVCLLMKHKYLNPDYRGWKFYPYIPLLPMYRKGGQV